MEAKLIEYLIALIKEKTGIADGVTSFLTGKEFDYNDEDIQNNEVCKVEIELNGNITQTTLNIDTEKLERYLVSNPEIVIDGVEIEQKLLSISGKLENKNYRKELIIKFEYYLTKEEV